MPFQLAFGAGDGTIPVRQVRQGQVAIIVAWPIEKYVGTLIQRRAGQLFVLGPQEGGRVLYVNASDEARVRVLPNGTTLTLTDNE